MANIEKNVQLKNIDETELWFPKTKVSNIIGLDSKITESFTDMIIDSLDGSEDELKGKTVSAELFKTLLDRVETLENNKYSNVWAEVPDPFNGYDYVDMGEAGIWATCNIGASKPEEYGLYFAWGETTGYPDVSGDKKFTWDDYKFGTKDNLTKYNSTDNLTTLELEDDAAHVNMGGNWRMPTTDEFVKLKELCNSEWTTNYNGTGIKGRIFKLKTDESKQLFFPTAGRCSSGSVIYVGSGGYVWSSSLYSYVSSGCSGCNLYFDSSYVNPQNGNDRYLGIGVRGFLGSGQ